MKPVFVGGHPRSGTTLLGAMIGAHSSCVCTPESQFKTRALRHASVEQNGRIDIAAAVNVIKQEWRFNIWGLDLQNMPYAEIHSYPELILWIVREYGEKSGKRNAGLWVDHTPSNVKNADALIGLFPQAKFIHIVRDGRGVAASIIPLDWGANTIDSAARSWSKRLSQYLHIESRLGDERIMRVGFEDLVRNPEATMKRICRFLCIDFQPEMVQGGGFTVPTYTAKQHALVGKPPDAGEADAWEKALRPREVEIFENLAGEMLSSLGYPLRYGGNALKMTMKEKIAANLEETMKREVINKARHWQRIKKGIATASKQHES
jgi:hypothetical protein